MTDSDASGAQELLARLADPAQAGELVGLGFDFMLEQPLQRFVSPDRVLEHLDAALSPAHVERVVGQHVRAFCDRDRERAKDRGDQVKDYLTPEAEQALRKVLSQPVVLDKAFLEELVRQDAVRHLLRSVVEETVNRFVQGLKPGGKGGLLGQLPRGPGMGLITKVAQQMEGQIQKAATAFVSSSLEVMLKRLVHILSSAETAEQLGRLRLQGFDALLPLHTRTLWKLPHQLPLDELFALAPDLVRHNLARADLRKTIRDEAEAILQVEGAQPLRDLLDPDAVRRWRAEVVELGGALLAEFHASEAFLGWLQRSG